MAFSNLAAILFSSALLIEDAFYFAASAIAMKPPMHLVLGLRKIAGNDSKMLISAEEA
jgi:hypothetical protein